MNIILGSSSKIRRELILRALERSENAAIRGAELSFDSPNIDEKSIRGPTAQETALLVAHAKADALLQRHESGVLVTSDSVVLCNGELREKPRDAAEARAFLRSYGEHTPTVITALVVVECASRRRRAGVSECSQAFRPLPEDFIDALIERGSVLGSAGALVVEQKEEYRLEMVGEYETFQGLPIKLLLEFLNEIAG